MFKNKDGKIRSGWKILLTTLVLFGFILTITFILQIPLIAYLTKTGDFDVATQFASERGKQIMSYYSKIAMVVQEVLMIIIPIISWTKFSKQPLRAMGLDSLGVHKMEMLSGFVFGFVSISLVFAGIVVSGNATVTSWKPQFSLDMILWLVFFIFVGFAEEIFGRGYIMAILRQTKSKVMVVLVSAIIFALLHSGNSGIGLIPYINLMLVGVLFAFMFIRSGNIWMCIGYHITWNFFQGFYGFPVSGIGTPSLIQMTYKENTIWNGGIFGPEGGLFVTIIIIVGVFFVHVYYKDSTYEFLNEISEKNTNDYEFAAVKDDSLEDRN